MKTTRKTAALLVLILLGFSSLAQDTINYGNPGYIFPQIDYSYGNYFQCDDYRFAYRRNNRGYDLESVANPTTIYGLSCVMPDCVGDGVTLMILKYIGPPNLLDGNIYLPNCMYYPSNPLDTLFQVVDSVRIYPDCPPNRYLRAPFDPTKDTIIPLYANGFTKPVILNPDSLYFVLWKNYNSSDYQSANEVNVFYFQSTTPMRIVLNMVRPTEHANPGVREPYIEAETFPSYAIPCIYPIVDEHYSPNPDNPCQSAYCQPVEGLNVETDVRVATFTWNSDSIHCAYELAYGPATQHPSTYTVVELTDTAYTFVGLDMTTQYACRVRGLCCEDSVWSRWSDTAQYRRDTRLVLATSNNNSWGIAQGGGRYDVGTDALLVAVPHDDSCRFACWNDGDTNNPRTITVTQDTLFRAYFEHLGQSAVPTVAPLTFTLSPNPTGSLLYVTIPNGTAIEMPGGGTRVEIFDDRGRKVAGYKFHTSKFEIDVSTLPDGHYTLRLSSGKKAGTKGFVKQR